MPPGIIVNTNCEFNDLKYSMQPSLYVWETVLEKGFEEDLPYI